MDTNKTENYQMLLGLHTYSLYLHGIGQAWAGFKLPWERQLSTFQLFDLGIELGLDGFHPKVMPFLQHTADLLTKTAPKAEEYGICLALENHCDSFSDEILWVLNQVDHPFVGACIDTVNAWHIAEDPMKTIENLAPVAFTNHFRDDRVEFCRDGFRVRGVAVGDGDIDMQKAYELIINFSPTKRINIETEMGISLEDRDTALHLEIETIKKSIHYCRTILNIGKDIKKIS